MTIPTDTKGREELLIKLRAAVAFQIGLSDALQFIGDAIDCDPARVSDYVSGRAAVADCGMELSHADLDDLLGIGVPGRIVVGEPLKPILH